MGKPHVPWWILDIANRQLITTPIIPGDISDSKSINWAEMQIPGMNYQPVSYGGLGNKEVSFNLMLLKRNKTVGNIPLLKQFEQLRQPKVSLGGIFKKSRQHTEPPRVLYNWGVGTIPLVYMVSSVSFVHKSMMTNQTASPQNTEVSITLKLDESHPLNRAEEMFRKVMAAGGAAAAIDQFLEAGGMDITGRLF